MDNLFKFGKHRLPEEGASKVVNFPINDVGAPFFVGGLGEKMMCEQFLVKRGGDFGEKNRVIVVLKGLGSLRKPGVHGMPCFVRECVDLSLIHISEPTRLLSISYAVFCLKKK